MQRGVNLDLSGHQKQASYYALINRMQPDNAFIYKRIPSGGLNGEKF